jgi:hypothetical protein
LRLKCSREPAKEAVVILDLVEGGGREDQIHRSLKLQVEEILASTRTRNPILSVKGVVGTQPSGWSKADSCGRTRSDLIARPRTNA